MNEPNLASAIKGRKKNPRVGLRYRDDEGLVIRVGFRDLPDDERAVIVRWYRTGYFTQEELAKLFHRSTVVVNKACRAFIAHAKHNRGALRRHG